MVGIRPPSESGYALFTDNPTNLVEHCLQASVKVGIIANGQYHVRIGRVIAGQQDRDRPFPSHCEPHCESETSAKLYT